jgi:hypothetical protein
LRRNDWKGYDTNAACGEGVHFKDEEESMRVLSGVLAFAVCVGIMTGSALYAAARGVADVPTISTGQLQAMLGNPDIVIIDVRSAHDWDGTTTKIKGAVREEAAQVAQWAAKYSKDKTIVLYCA